MLRPLSFVIPGADSLTLVQAVAAELRRAFPDLRISNADARRVVIAGAARVNGQRLTRPGAPVRGGDRIAIAADPSRFARTRQLAAAPATLGVLYRDEHLVAVNKPGGLPTHATADPGRPHLVALAARALGVGEAALGLHQRLDAGTSGIVLFALTPEANRGLAAAFAGREVEKTYLCIADARRRPDLRPGVEWTSRGAVSPTGTGRRGRRVGVAAEGAAAETAFAVRERHGARIWLEARPATGRQHQIRAHLADAQAPIVGDARYGGPAGERLYLHAWRLALAHPVTGTPLVLEAPVPADWLSGR